jgi:hypothetical protein
MALKAAGSGRQSEPDPKDLGCSIGKVIVQLTKTNMKGGETGGTGKALRGHKGSNSPHSWELFLARENFCFVKYISLHAISLNKKSMWSVTVATTTH